MLNDCKEWLDKIKNIKILDESRKALKEVKGGGHGLNLPMHIAEHIYMFDGDLENYN